MSKSKGKTELRDPVADTAPNGDGVGVSVPVPEDREPLVKAVIYGPSAAKAEIDHAYNNAPEFDELVRDHEAEQDAREASDVIKLQPSAKGDPQQVETQQSVSPQDATERHAFMASGSLVPPYDPAQMVHLFEHSNSLRQNVDAYVNNIDAYGFRFEPTINLESDDLEAQIRVAMFEDKVIGGESDPTMPTDAEVKAQIEEIRQAMAVEKIKLEFFFRNCVMNESFVAHRMNTRQDQEITGNGYWEVLRDREGNLAQFILVPTHTVRLMPQGKELVRVEQNVQATPITFTKRVFRRRFRTYVQMFNGKRVYFKEYTDPRIISAKTGRPWESVDKMKQEEGADATEANELIHFTVHSSRSPYGVPRWIGALLSVLGSRQAEEVNFTYFDNKAVPPLAVLVSGGRVSEETTNRLRDFIENEIKGRNSYHKILVLEAEPASGTSGPEHTGRMKIELKPLTQAIHNDALFQGYDKENIQKVGQAFRLPPLLRGDSRDFNRATANAVLKFTEQQIFAPERNRFDDKMNRLILPDLGVCFHRFKSLSPKTTDPEDAAKVVERLAKIGALVPRDVRVLAEEILNVELKRIEEPWMDIPLPLATSGRIAELLEGPDDLFDPGSGTSTQTPLGGGEPGPQGPDEEPTGEQVAQILAALTSDSLASGGALQPAQGSNLRQAPRSIFSNGQAKRHAQRLLRIRNILKAAELAAREHEVAAAEFAKSKDQVEPGGQPTEVEKILVPREVWDSFGIIPDDEE